MSSSKPIPACPLIPDGVNDNNEVEVNMRTHPKRAKGKVLDTKQDVYHTYREIWTEVPILGELTLFMEWRQFLVEMIGTALLVFFGTGAAISSIPLDGLNAGSIVSTALSFGLVVTTVVYAIGSISGGHINPAITLGFMVAMKIPLLKGLLFIGFQCVGAIIGSALVYGVFPRNLASNMKFGANSVNVAGIWTPDRGSTWEVYAVSIGGAVLLEAVLGFILVLTVLTTCALPRSSMNRGDFAPIAIGLAVVVSHLVAIPLTGTSMNPARSLGPAVLSGYWTNHWVFWVGPFIGAIIAAIVYKYLLVTPIGRIDDKIEKSQKKKDNKKRKSTAKR